jgi:hypothetical protein
MLYLRFLFLVLILARVPPPAVATNPVDRLRLNQIQVIGSHNSFKLAIDRELFERMVATNPGLRNLDYAHPSLTDQLNLGLRNLELDIYYDPQGGRYAQPLGLSVVRQEGGEPRPYDPEQRMRRPGFKVLHVQDIDFRSNCLTLQDALHELRAWSQANPRHLPVIVTFNANQSPIEWPGTVKPLEFDADAFDELDQEFFTGLGRDELIMPDEVRGQSQTLKSAIQASGWPLLASVRGRFLLVLDEQGESRDRYLAGHPSLRGRAMFVNSDIDSPEAAVMIRNDPVHGASEIAELVKHGFLVRTRADADTQEARSGDLARFEAAKRSGAQVITTDYYLSDWRLNPAFRVRFEHGACSRINPVTAPGHTPGPLE